LETRDKELYHQIDPVKLATDWGSGLVSLALLWRRRPVPAIVVGFVPSVAVSAALMSGDEARLERLRDSSLGGYIGRYMTPWAQAARGAGFALSAYGAWKRNPALVALGLLVIALAWGWGLLLPSGTAHFDRGTMT
jgi:hypothetical protein